MVQLGADLDCEAAGDKFCVCIDISADGNRLAVGALWNTCDTGHDSRTLLRESTVLTWIVKHLGKDYGEALRFLVMVIVWPLVPFGTTRRGMLPISGIFPWSRMPLCPIMQGYSCWLICHCTLFLEC
jgi:hypothetical protein